MIFSLDIGIVSRKLVLLLVRKKYLKKDLRLLEKVRKQGKPKD